MVKAGDRSPLLDEQILYYQARAHEYDEWFFRQGRYDRGNGLNKQWFTEIERVWQALDEFRPTGHVLEIACGTGLWTERLLQHAKQVTAIDAASEVLAINQARIQSPKMHYLQTDIFEWSPEVQHDAVFFGFWLSHVPPERFGAFWNLVDRALKPEGRVFFVDSQYDATSTAKDHLLKGSETTIAKRRLNDGREFRIVKVFYDPTRLTKQLTELGWRFKVKGTDTYFIYGSGHKEGV